MTTRSTLLGALLLLAGAGVGACGSGSSSAPLATVEFVYFASTTPDPAVESAFPDCFHGTDATHIHPSWRGFDRVDLTPVPPDRFVVLFFDVPVGVEQRFRINDPNECDANATGATTANIHANGVLLTRVVDTPGNGTEPGLAFTVLPDGSVAP
jgi:hypothetical protein